MRKDVRRILAIGCLWASLVGCQKSGTGAASGGNAEDFHDAQSGGSLTLAESPIEPGETDAQHLALIERVKQVAAEYQRWGRVDDEVRWAPFLCRSPNPSFSRFSRSEDAGTHGQKLYFVFARNQADYFNLQQAQAKGQVIVKQSWHPVETDPPPAKAAGRIDSAHAGAVYTSNGDAADYFQPYAKKDGTLYRTGKQGPLFIMMKVGDELPADETDAGWVYATVEPDNIEVTGLGRVASCLKCHQDAPSDRLFGLPQ